MSQNELFKKAKEDGLYDPRFEHDNCGIGAVVNIKGVKSHATVENALIEQVRMPREKPVTVLVSYYRFHINSLRKSQSL